MSYDPIKNVLNVVPILCPQIPSRAYDVEIKLESWYENLPLMDQGFKVAHHFSTFLIIISVPNT